MPEKIASKPETNGYRTPEKVEDTARKYMQEAENITDDALRMYKELMVTTTNYYYGTFGRAVRQSMELSAQATKTTEDILSVYRRFYTGGTGMWQAYWQDVTNLVARPK
jgi:hypothetical protein